MTNCVGLDQTAPIGTVCSGSTLFPSIPNWSVMLGNYLQQTTSADNIFRCIFFLAHQGLTQVFKYGKNSNLFNMLPDLQIRVHVFKNQNSYFSTKAYVVGTQKNGQ